MRTRFERGAPDAIQDSRSPVCCLFCESPLTLHQPDEDLADRLLGTCAVCKSWFLTNFEGSTLVVISDLLEDPPLAAE